MPKKKSMDIYFSKHKIRRIGKYYPINQLIFITLQPKTIGISKLLFQNNQNLQTKHKFTRFLVYSYTTK
jgi:hypothetical protein